MATRRAAERFSLALLPLLAAWALLACAPPEPVRIGFVGGLSGRVADLGSEGKDGAQLAIEQANAADGLAGRRIELLVRDDAQDAETARRAMRELIDAGVEVIVGPMTSAMAEVVIPLADEAGVTLISPTVTSSRFSGRDDHFFRVISATTEYARAAAGFLAGERGARRAALIIDQGNLAYTADWAEQFGAAFAEGGGAVLRVERFSSGEEASLLPQVARMLEARPDALVVVAGAVDAARIVQLLRQRAAQLDLLIADWAATERFVELGGAAAEGVFAPQYFDREDQAERFRAFRAAYEERFGASPGFASVAGYDAANVALAAVAGRSGASVKARLLAQGRFEGVQRSIVFDRYGDSSRPIHLTVVREGRFMPASGGGGR
ncbi:ABC transporter substrate-binding protein [Thauera sp. CAU 1555]|uniref:ABC transporter substrate-binding protein n=1 Tax=Thauera sedimentorum TaxID=2767595 RepID=A0ABR9BEZ1_9RHOO|nr:ABC transporter substrate-binding protein [Thauera sedimentorum]MBC9073610.1 ABC transporter substrate-binding protein [Thauera sedimentorum]MBD8504529.1 ABC transporter substrate-binding protein [Thauera sedimentorum]